MITAESKAAGLFDGKVYGDKLMSAMPGGLQGMIDEIGHPPPFTPDELAKYMEKHKKEIQDNLKKMGDEATAAGDKDGAAAISKLSEATDKPEFAQGLSKVINGSKLKTEKKDDKDVLTPDSKLDWSKESVQSLFSPEVVSAFNRSAMRQATAKDPELTKLLETEAPAKEAESKAHAQKVHDALQALITKLKSKEASDLLK
jgi:hypothetical protein